MLAALSTDRVDEHDALHLLLSFDADVRRRGVTGWAPPHDAVTRRDPKAIEFLLARGADPTARAWIDDHTTPPEDVAALGLTPSRPAPRDDLGSLFRAAAMAEAHAHPFPTALRRRDDVSDPGGGLFAPSRAFEP